MVGRRTRIVPVGDTRHMILLDWARVSNLGEGRAVRDSLLVGLVAGVAWDATSRFPTGFATLMGQVARLPLRSDGLHDVLNAYAEGVTSCTSST